MRTFRLPGPLLGTLTVFGLLYAAAAARDPRFLSATVAGNLFKENAVLGLAAVGMTFVILGGGIDLSVGAVVGLTSVIVAVLVQDYHVPPAAAAVLGVAFGVAFGAGAGALIHGFGLPAFLVTLAGMFLARGTAFVVRLEPSAVRHPLFDMIERWGENVFPLTSLVFLLAVAAALYVENHTAWGRAVYALGGDENAALLMGLPVAATRVGVYALSGGCAALAGVLHVFYTSGGDPSAANMLELDAIAAVVIGGTRLSGGVGSVAGTLVGVLILAMIQTFVTFEGNLNSWWARIFVGALLLTFILPQRLLAGRRDPRT